MKCPTGFLYPNLPEVGPCLLLQKESGIIVFHLRLTSITGQVPRSPPRGLLLNRRPAQPGSGLGAPPGSASPGSRALLVTRVSLPPASLRAPHAPNPRAPRAPADRSRSHRPACPLGVPGSSPGYLGAEPRRGLSPQAPGFPGKRPPARAASPARRPSPGLGRPLPSGPAAPKPPTPKAGPGRKPTLSKESGGDRRQCAPSGPRSSIYHLSIYLSTYLSIHPSIYLCIHLASICLSPTYASIDLSICLPTPLLSIQPSIHHPSCRTRIRIL